MKYVCLCTEVEIGAKESNKLSCPYFNEQSYELTEHIPKINLEYSRRLG
jgi:hypothetical protein